MKRQAAGTWNCWRNRILTACAIAALAVPVVAGVLTAATLRAQTPAAQSAVVLEWQTAAGGKMEFDVASVKPNKSNDPQNSNVNFGPGDIGPANGGRFSAINLPLLAYIAFAYKLTIYEMQSLLLELPKWATMGGFDIEARAEGNPTKDQMRLMMQSLLADRFKLVFHRGSRQLPVYALVLARPGKTGPQFQPHSVDEPCSAAFPSSDAPPRPAVPSAPSSTSGLQLPAGMPCGGQLRLPASTPDRVRFGARNIAMPLIVDFLKNPRTGVDRPVIDGTGLTGTFDFSLEWSPASDPTQEPPTSQPDPSGPTFLEALQEQFGLKLKPTTGSVDVFVIDHVQEPSPN